MEDTWEAKQISKNMAKIVNNDTEMLFGNFRISTLATEKDNDKLFEDIVNAYSDYFRKERKQRILHAEILPSRVLVISEKGGTGLAEFKLKKNEEVIKDFQIVAKIMNSYENYLKSVRIKKEEEKYGW
ncbi:MAG: hypothetical protein K0S47_2414 [Herbinix sp.]|jgi:hypothetical protein|nr:hypothetical protein [Herbinix sp.]